MQTWQQGQQEDVGTLLSLVGLCPGATMGLAGLQSWTSCPGVHCLMQSLRERGYIVQI